MKKVLIVSWYFAPCSRMGAKRFGIMCKYFMENGYEPYVITTSSSYTKGGAKSDLEIPISSENIFEINVDKEENFLMQIILWIFKILKLHSRAVDASYMWYKSVIKTLDIEQLKNIAFDIVIGTYDPMADLCIAKYLSKKLRCKYIIDIRDFISDEKETTEGKRRTFKLDYVIEKLALSHADGIVTISPEMSDVMRKRFRGKRIVTVYNGWEGRQTKRNISCGEKYLYYAGQFYERYMECFEVFLQALKKVNEQEKIKMLIRSIGPERFNVKIKKMAKRMGMEEYVTVLPSADNSVVEEERQKAYINIVLNTVHDEYQRNATLPGKTYEYMSEKTPILAISPENSRLAKLLRYTDKGIATNKESEMVDFILNADGKYEGNKNVLKFSRKYQAARLCRFMDKILEN